MSELLIEAICVVIGMIFAGVITYFVFSGKEAAVRAAVSEAKSFMEDYGDALKEYDKDLYNKAVAAIGIADDALADGKLTLMEIIQIATAFGYVFKRVYELYDQGELITGGNRDEESAMTA